MARYRVNGTLRVKKSSGCLGFFCILFVVLAVVGLVVGLFEKFLPVILIVCVILLIAHAASKRSKQIGQTMTKNAQLKESPVELDQYNAPSAGRVSEIADDCERILETTKSIPTFVSRYKTLQKTLFLLANNPVQADFARTEWEQALFYYPARLHSVIDRAAADAMQLKTPRGQFNRFEQILSDLNSAFPYNEQISEALEMEKARIVALRDDCVLHGKALDAPATDKHVSF